MQLKSFYSFLYCFIPTFFLGFFGLQTMAQPVKKDTAKKQVKPIVAPITIIKDTLPLSDTIIKPKIVPIFKSDTSHLYYKFIKTLSPLQAELIPIKSLPVEPKKGKDWLFFIATGLVILIGLLKNFFGEHGTNVFKVIFKGGLKNNDANKKLNQALLPSLLLNVLFAFIFGGFLYYYILYTKHSINYIVLLLFLIIIYIGKFFCIKLLTWLLQHSEAGKVYILRFFMVNQIAALVFAPILIFLMLGKNVNEALVFKVGFIFAAALYIFRLFYSTLPYRRFININWLHFVFFIICIELLPLLIIQKTFNLYFIK